MVRALDDDDITEIMLNPDGLVWTEGQPHVQPLRKSYATGRDAADFQRRSGQ